MTNIRPMGLNFVKYSHPYVDYFRKNMGSTWIVFNRRPQDKQIHGSWVVLAFIWLLYSGSCSLCYQFLVTPACLWTESHHETNVGMQLLRAKKNTRKRVKKKTGHEKYIFHENSITNITMEHHYWIAMKSIFTPGHVLGPSCVRKNKSCIPEILRGPGVLGRAF